MKLSAGARLGPYEVVDVIGHGGMGEVYRARDPRMDRMVAIKTLPESRSGEPGRARFERELRAIARLNHPHICSVYDVGTEGSDRYLVMELVEGRTLEERLAEGALRVPDALTHAVEIADALESAHHHGVTHRDLKPANIMITPLGVKLLDFGIAQIRESDDEPAAADIQALTMDGDVVGTPPYMAPEQLDGGPVDARADLFALGVILYEMLTGRRPFPGKTRASLIAAVLEREPEPLAAEPSGANLIPRALERVVAKCLAKSPDARWQTARDLGDELRWIAASGAALPPSVATRRTISRWPAALTGAALVVGIGAAVTSLGAPDPPDPAREVRFAVPPPAGYTLDADLALAPDGSRLAFVVADAGGNRRLALHAFDSMEPTILGDTAGAQQPFWSPDSKSLAFFADRTLKILGPTSKAAAHRTKVQVPSGGSWGHDNLIVFAPQRNGILYTVPALGGPPAPLTALEGGETAHTGPRFFAGSRTFLFRTGGTQRIVAASLDTPKHQTLLESSHRSPAVAAAGHLIFLRGGALVAQRLDATRLEVQGEPISLGDRIAPAAAGAFSGAWFDVTPTTLAILRPALVGREFAWVDRRGRRQRVIAGSTDLENPDLSPDGTQIVAVRPELDLSRQTLQLLDLRSGAPPRELASGGLPAWSPDGRSIAYGARTADGQGTDIYRRRMDAETSELIAAKLERNANVQGWTPDGSHVVFTSVDDKSGWDLWILPVDGDRRPQPLVKTPGNDAWGAISPDGRWLAYSSDEGGVMDIYLQRLSGGERRVVSAGGGAEPRWRADGRELYYLRGSEMIAVAVSGGERLALGVPQVLFKTEFSATSPRTRYIPSRDGTRFLVVRPRSGDAAGHIEIVLNWQSLLPTR